jgi:hypothetical protein
MISKFKQTLRMAALEDLLRYQLEVRPNMASWMTRLAWDVAAENDIDLMAYRGNALLSQALDLIDASEHRDILRSAARNSEAFAEFLARPSISRRVTAATGLQRVA